MRKFIIFFIAVLLLSLSSCSDSPIMSEISNDPDDYMNINGFVSESIQSNSRGLLPAATMERTNAEYYYHYECALVGDPAYVVYLKNEYPDSGKFHDEQKRIAALLPCEMILDEHTILYTVDDIYSELELYLDDEILDGAGFYIEMAIINTQNQTIEYLTALQWDSHERDEYVMKFVKHVIYIPLS